MPSLKTYDLFISHAWKYGDQYDRIVNMLDSAPYFTYRNYSAPEDKPIVPYGTTISNTMLENAINNKIRPVNAVIVLSGMYVAYHDWLQYEIDVAKHYKKPIIGVRPWGSEVVPGAVTAAADIIVGWNTMSIVDAIREYSI